ncbi:PREDICTED: DNA-directed RNA polymerase I subunit RPA1 [Polistes dominula]|uniref:DNA-directed RNA polymerase subunit n=1 Tax=Polistes dominula TaxID=743375 RepID=A0ABM1IRK3_POLDO|nr:PREDICTED: DNA-directed RNA polymerase I subunit RPA1 [Polistes dominula]
MQKYQEKRLTPKHLDPKYLTFSFFTTKEIEQLSVMKIRTPLSFNILGHPLKGGLYDPALGPLLESSDPCATCGSTVYKCPGHFGHIELPMPTVNPLFHKPLFMLIKLSCLNCFTLQIPTHIKMLLCAKLKILEMGLLSDIDSLEEEINSVTSKSQNIPESDLVYIQDIIENYIRNLVNKKKYVSNGQSNETLLNTKNVIAQRHLYIDSILKKYTVGKICINCHEAIPKITALKNKIMTTKISDGAFTSTDMMSNNVVYKLENVIIMPDQSKEYLRKLWQNEEDFIKMIIPCLSNVKEEYATDIFFFDVIPVLPPIVRPVNFLHGQMIEHPQSQVYKSIIQDCLILRNIIQYIQHDNTNLLPEEGKMVYDQIKGSTAVEKLHYAWQSLQTNVDHLMDRELNKTSESANCLGLKQVIEKKEGIIRMHMMGKRVNYAARTVITPDPNLDIDEIGVPEIFALKLTYPVPVTPWNVLELRKLVLNGPNVFPGAVTIENEDGTVQRLSPIDITKREAVAKRLLPSSDKANRFFKGIKVVHRHLQNGDILLINRQPTLHKSSIMAHKARILKGEKTLRLHYANCKSFNADFDGDEMNAHFPQNELARSEGYLIANVSNQYLVPKDGTPLSGLIQDHVISGVRLTMRGQFFNRTDYMQLVYCGLVGHKGDLQLLPPSILKPVPLWSGKQIISTVLINIIPPNTARINLNSTAKINGKQWQTNKARPWKCGREFTNSEQMSEAEVIIRNGELLCGVLDKMHYGATPYGLVHCVYELYGGSYSSKLLSAFGKLFQAFLQREGFTLGIEDILVVSKADMKRKEIILQSRTLGEEVQKSLLEMPADTPSEVLSSKIEESYWADPKFRTQVDRKYKNVLDVYTNNINKTCLPAGLLKKFPHNNLQLMVQSGAKGSMVNTMQISCLLGQIELEGKRPPLMISGKSLPSFPAYDPTPRAGGFIDGRFMTGIRPQEFFFHCMAGREGLIDTAVKTSRSGYLQRCLIKHLEGLVVNYDSTVRDSDGSLIQIYYGEDGLDIPASTFLKKDQIDFLIDNQNVIVDPNLVKSLKQNSNYESTLKSVKRIKKWSKKRSILPNNTTRRNEFCIFSEENYNPNSAKSKFIDRNSGRSKATLSLLRKWIRMDEETKQLYKKQCSKCPDPLISKFRQDTEFGVLSERLENLMDEYMSNKSVGSKRKIEKKELRDLLWMKVMKSICPPGEPVGLLAAQSIGEPSTQMTLNTFHHSGRSEMNVTLGIPRLREILMMASKMIKTPSMEIPFKKGLHNLSKKSNELRKTLTKCMLTDVLKTIRIDREMVQLPNRRLVHTLHIEFLPYKCYKSEFCVNPESIINKTENMFFKALFQEMKKSKLTGNLIHVEEEKKQGKNEDALLDEDEREDQDTSKTPKTTTNIKRDFGEEHESSDEEEVAEDADATVKRTMSRHQENQEYEEDSEDTENEIEDGNEKEDGNNETVDTKLDVKRSNEDSKLEGEGEGEGEGEEDDENVEYINNDAKDIQKRRQHVLEKYLYALEYEFDQDKSLWCKFKFWLPMKMIKIDLPTIIRKAASKVILWETPNIRKAFTIEGTNGETILKTDGLNIIEMFKYNEILDLSRLYSNDIYGISQTYGIEAANKVIIREVKDVFKMYGITVDFRHLSLIADYMTFDGTFKPLSRKGMDDSASPLQQMSFESSLNFLRNATLQGKKDDLKSPSSRLMLGQPCKSGTGAFSLLAKIH